MLRFLIKDMLESRLFLARQSLGHSVAQAAREWRVTADKVLGLLARSGGDRRGVADDGTDHASPMWPSMGADLLFSLRTFAAAMLALWIGLRLDLPRPYWAVATVYIVTQPLSGALRSKAVYRVLGTLLGAAITVVLVPNLVNSPEILSLALALWTGLCLYLALLDRTPRSYLFMLAGYTAAIIGFPAVSDPGAIFATAVDRVEEITLGILCATVAGSVIFPRHVGPVLSARLDTWLRDAGQWSLDALAGRKDDEATLADQRRLAADAVDLHMLATYLAYDTSLLRGATRWVRLLQQRMVMLLPVLSAITDRMAALRRDGGELPPAVQAVLADLSAWIGAGAKAPTAAIKLRAAIDRLEPTSDAGMQWKGMLLSSLLARLRQLVDVLQDCGELRDYVAAGGDRSPPRRLIARASAGAALHRDHGMAMLSAFAATLTVLVCCALWIASGWPDGATAAQMSAVACCIFAALDDPVPAILGFIRAALVSLIVVAAYLFAVLPAIDGFPMLVLVLAPTFLTLGLLMTKPRWVGGAIAVAVNSASMMTLHNTFTAEFASFLNTGLSMVVGISLAAIVTGVVRSVGAEWSARRLLRACWADLADVASRPDSSYRRLFAGRMLDRLGILTPRLAAVAPGANVAATDTLTDLRVGLNVVHIQRFRSTLPSAAREALGATLDELARHFRDLSTRRLQQPTPRLLWLIDRALDGVIMAKQVLTTHRMLLALVGVRRGLFPDASSYEPASPPAEPASPRAENHRAAA